MQAKLSNCVGPALKNMYIYWNGSNRLQNVRFNDKEINRF